MWTPILLAAALAAGDSTPGRFEPADGVRAVLVTDQLSAPLFATSPPGDPRLFVVEQGGRIRILRGGHLAARSFLDLSRIVSAGGERGLLGLAFHPDYARNGLLFVDYTDRHGDTRVVRYRARGEVADPASAESILFVRQPYSNHNGGMLAFGPDGKLYVGMGDGGSGGDPNGNGQNTGTLLAKILRLDVDSARPYAIPPDNPFVHRADARPEIWAYGVRNPWRFSFDHGHDRLYLADVGQNAWEEIDVAPASAGGLDYGWNLREGRHDFGPPRSALVPLLEPIVEYGHDEGCSVIGGYCYRGRRMAGLQGTYFFSDYCRGDLRSFRWLEAGAAPAVPAAQRARAGEVRERRRWRLGRLGSVTSFGEDADGELYVTTQEGRLYRLETAR